MRSRIFTMVLGLEWAVAIGLLRAQAQVIPDSTLGPEATQVVPVGAIEVIRGGAQRDANLFHSFQEFNISTEQGIYFHNPAGVDRIFARVTGQKPSFINGVLGILGTADLFFLNPHGIRFGAAAQLDVRGSFLASTASQVQFANGRSFSAIAPVPVLSVSVPVGLGFGSPSGAIQVEGTGHSLRFPELVYPITALMERGGLQMRPGKTFALLGRDVTVAGGQLTAWGGRVELGSVESGTIALSPDPRGWQFDYGQVTQFRDIQVRDRGLVDVSGAPAGEIHLQGRDLNLHHGGLLLSQNLGTESSGAIVIDAERSFQLIGNTFNKTIPSGLFTETSGSGVGGAIQIRSPHIQVQDGNQILTRTFGPGQGGSVDIQATTIALDGVHPTDFRVASFIGSMNIAAAGDSGAVTVKTRNLLLQNGASMTTSNILSTGASGPITVQADEIVIRGTSPLLAASAISAIGFGYGNAGAITVMSDRLTLQDSGTITTSNSGYGNAGNMSVQAAERITIAGHRPGSSYASNISSGIGRAGEVYYQAFGLPAIPVGNAGTLTIQTPQLTVTDNAYVSVANIGRGNAGTLTIQSDRIQVTSGGSIVAYTLAGEGGNLEVQTETMVMRDRAYLSAAAGALGNGGNLRVRAGAIALLDQSFISANAIAGHGGNIQLQAQGLFKDMSSAITASSDLGLDGTITVNGILDSYSNVMTPQLSYFVADDQIVAGSCLAKRNVSQGRFVISGNGGIPENPYDRQSIAYEQDPQDSPSAIAPVPSASMPIQEATKLVKTADGRSFLIREESGPVGEGNCP